MACWGSVMSECTASARIELPVYTTCALIFIHSTPLLLRYLELPAVYWTELEIALYFSWLLYY